MTGGPYVSPPPVLLADRVKRARATVTCAICRGPITVGEREGHIPEVGWAHLVPCVINRNPEESP
jgi:hypothetical protein